MQSRGYFFRLKLIYAGVPLVVGYFIAKYARAGKDYEEQLMKEDSQRAQVQHAHNAELFRQLQREAEQPLSIGHRGNDLDQSRVDDQEPTK
jgi:hypothetical protein